MARILLVAPTCDAHDVGEAWVAYQWASRLAERHAVTLLTYHKLTSIPAAQQLLEVEVIEWPELRTFVRFERFNSMLKPTYPVFYGRARRWIREAIAAGRRFDVVFQPLPVAMRYPSPATGLGIPLIMGPVGGGLRDPADFSPVDGAAPWFVRLRELDRIRLRWDPFLNRTYSSADVVLGIAPYVRELLGDVPLRRFEIMPETGLEELPAGCRRPERANGSTRFLFVGRLIRTKGARHAIEALAQLPTPCEIDIVGDGPDRQYCEDLAEELGLGSRVRFHGWRRREDVQGFYRNADAFVFPSYREPGGNVTLEAMSHGLPVVVCDRGGPATAVSDACAFRLPVTTERELVSQLVGAMLSLHDKPGLRASMGEAARDHVARTGMWSSRLDRFDDLVESVLIKHGNHLPQPQGTDAAVETQLP